MQNGYAKDQSKYGKSSVGKNPGSVDGVIKNNEIEIFIEAFNLKSLNRKIITNHIRLQTIKKILCIFIFKAIHLII